MEDIGSPQVPQDRVDAERARFCVAASSADGPAGPSRLIVQARPGVCFRGSCFPLGSIWSTLEKWLADTLRFILRRSEPECSICLRVSWLWA